MAVEFSVAETAATDVLLANLRSDDLCSAGDDDRLDDGVSGVSGGAGRTAPQGQRCSSEDKALTGGDRSRLVDCQPKTLFRFDSGNYEDFQDLFRGETDHEYYAGNCWAEFAFGMTGHARRRRVGASSIIYLNSQCRVNFRRTRQHVRQDGTDLMVLWFIRDGIVEFSNQQGTLTAKPGGFMMTRSTEPFFMRCSPPRKGGCCELLHVTVPTHVLREMLGEHVAPIHLINVAIGEIEVALKIFEQVFADDCFLADASAHLLIRTAFALVGTAVKQTMVRRPARITLSDKRQNEILRYIDRHLANPNLSIAVLAKGCAISPRYISTLLKMRETTFSRLVWTARLERAREWLINSDPLERSIEEISFGVGFKSPAHFSRMFKKAYEENPRTYRLKRGRFAGAAQTG